MWVKSCGSRGVSHDQAPCVSIHTQARLFFIGSCSEPAGICTLKFTARSKHSPCEHSTHGIYSYKISTHASELINTTSTSNLHLLCSRRTSVPRAHLLKVRNSSRAAQLTNYVLHSFTSTLQLAKHYIEHRGWIVRACEVAHGDGSTEEILLRHATEFHSTEAGYSGHASHTWGTTRNIPCFGKSRPTSLTEPAEACS